MRITVDMAKCEDHGQCVIAAPGVFEFNDDGKLVYNATPDASERDYVLDAADVCPAQAISIEED
jgi:ferredoxin